MVWSGSRCRLTMLPGCPPIDARTPKCPAKLLTRSPRQAPSPNSLTVSESHSLTHSHSLTVSAHRTHSNSLVVGARFGQDGHGLRAPARVVHIADLIATRPQRQSVFPLCVSCGSRLVVGRPPLAVQVRGDGSRTRFKIQYTINTSRINGISLLSFRYPHL